jgi:FimV-like protein
MVPRRWKSARFRRAAPDPEDSSMTRTLFRFWLIALLLGPVCALGLEIGEIQVHSSLNQLFDARIPLPKLAPEELGKVSVKLAPASMFKEFQLERVSALTNLVFSIEYNAEGQVYVKVVSTKPIQEPSLGLLLEFGWPRGKTFREFTVFLDPVRRLATQRPGDRSKTVLDTPAATLAPVPAPPIEPAPAIVAATTEPEPGAYPEGGDEPESKPAVPAMPEAAETAGPAPLPVEAPPAPVRVYRPGDTYGPVAEGEGLWGIALKVRPDPGITREQMMQSLLQANPHAFGKAGIDALKIGAVLRIPSLREIADITGSATARHLAETERSTAAATAPPLDPAPTTTESPAATAASTILEVFPLEPPELPEPVVNPELMANVALPSPATAPPVPTPESAKPSKSVKVESEPAPTQSELIAMVPEPLAPLEPIAVPALPSAPTAEAAQPVSEPEPETTPSGPAMAESESVPAAGPESSAAPPEPAALAIEPAVVVSEPAAAQPGDVLEGPTAVTFEPVSVTPLLFLAVSEMVAAIAQPPAMTFLETATRPLEPEASAVPEPPVMASRVETPVPAPTVMPEPLATPATAGEPPVGIPVTETSVPASTAVPEPPAAPTLDTTKLLAVVDKHLSRPSRDSQLQMQMHLASDVSLPMAAALADSLSVPALLADTNASPAVEIEEVPAPVVADVPQLLAAGPAESPARASEPSMPQGQGGDQYGPVAPNERLWDIAAKVRPDPAIGKEYMMKALLKTNPQAFSKPNNMDSLKVGAILRIPTLQEIVEYTDSKAAKQLLEQRQAAETPAPPPPAPEPVVPPPAPATETAPAPEPAPASETPSTPEPSAAEPAAEVPPTPEPPEPESTPDSETLPVPEPAPTSETPPVRELAVPEPAPVSETPPTPEPSAPESSPAPAPEPAPASETPSTPEPSVPEPAAEVPPTPELPEPESTPDSETLPIPEPVAPEPASASETPSTLEPPVPESPAPESGSPSATPSIPEPPAPQPTTEASSTPESVAPEPTAEAPPTSESSAPAAETQPASVSSIPR